ncbi:hypothetical protein [Streptomyces sp. NPDC051776]|uniref:hypothetical protein n=1 Tax=Streptomyces sp. NPDC051776 TaxID=3155414 RepID=UPI0034460CC5
MALHGALFADGVLMYGTITAPLPSTGAHAAWQVYAGVVDVPSSPDELDLGELMAQTFGKEYSEVGAYTESFVTDMGLGFGFMAQPPVRVPEGTTDETSDDCRIGLAGALACPVGGVQGLLVIGTSLNPEQVREMAGLVAAIAGRSVFVDVQVGQ